VSCDVPQGDHFRRYPPEPACKIIVVQDILVLIAVSQLNVSSFPAFAVRGETLLELTAYVHDGSDVTISVDWDNGGAPSTFFVPVANQTELTFNHTYQTTGTFTVTMS